WLELRFHGRGEFGGERIVDGILHEDAIGADAGLAGVPVFGGDGPFNGGIEIGIIENDERSVAAEFERELLDGSSALRHQQLADFRSAGESHLANEGIGRKLAADFCWFAGDDVEDPCRNSSALSQFTKGEGGERSLLGGFEDNRATRSNGGS